MRPPEQVKRELVGQWLVRAEADLAVAERLLPEGDRHAWAVAFHSQQAVEKFLKAFLVRWQIEFPKTHDLAQILGLVEAKDKVLAKSLCDATALTPYGVEVRYPGDSPKATSDDARHAVQLAALVRQRIRDTLRPYLAAREA